MGDDDDNDDVADNSWQGGRCVACFSSQSGSGLCFVSRLQQHRICNTASGGNEVYGVKCDSVRIEKEWPTGIERAAWGCSLSRGASGEKKWCEWLSCNVHKYC